MANWILARTLTLVGILGVQFSPASAKHSDPAIFTSEREAREYLKRNPAGPQATSAFLALSEFRSSNQNTGLTREQIVSNFGSIQLAQATSQRHFPLPSETTAQDMY